MSIKNTKKDEKLFSSIYKEKNGFKRWQIERAKVVDLAVGCHASELYKLFVARYLGFFIVARYLGFFIVARYLGFFIVARYLGNFS